MLSRIFPKQIDNDFRGYKLAIWLLALLLLFKTSISVNAVGWNPLMTSGEVLQRADRIPLDTFGANAADTAVLLFAVWGVTHLVLNLLGFIALVRYRTMIPLIYLLMAIDHIGRKAATDAFPILRVSDGTVSVPVNLILIALLLIGFGMSLTTPERREGAA
ncbi:MAG: hypothetical protein JNL06_10035 [Alphaproteobacteria bacterium]|nr:hypothetical protein [Alphaproteobacteria bacterium]